MRFVPLFPPWFFCSWVTAWVKTPTRWAGTGRILVEEFNDNCDKIDAALKALEDAQTVVKLLDMTTTEVLSEVTLDLSGIDLTRYHKLDIWLMPNLSGTGGRTARLYANGTDLLCFASAGYNAASLSGLCFHIYLGHSIGGSATYCYIGSSDVSGAVEPTLRASRITPGQLTSFRLVIEPTGNSTAPAQMEIGSTLQIYGLKK